VKVRPKQRARRVSFVGAVGSRRCCMWINLVAYVIIKRLKNLQ